MDTPIQKSPAIQTLFDHFDEPYVQEMVMQRHHCYLAAMEEYAAHGRALQFAHGFASFLAVKSAQVRPIDLLAGHSQSTCCAASIPFIYEEMNFDPHNHPHISFDVEKEARLYRQWQGDALTAGQDADLSWFVNSIECGLGKRWANGHVLPGFAYIIQLGLGPLEETLRQNAAACPPQDTARKEYYEAMRTVAHAAQGYILRYRQSALDAQAKAETPAQAANMARIADACAHIATKPAATFFQAIQLLWLLHEMALIENHSGSMSLGRVDQILAPFYEKEKAAGTLTMEDAGELMDALWLKIASIPGGFQNLTVGGCGPDGKCAANDLTLLALRASNKLGKDQPLLTMRITADTPDVYWEEAQRLIMRGGGFPALFNDEVVMDAKRAAGVAEEDAWNYGIIGCVEPSIAGKEYSNTEEMRLNLAKVLELMLQGGACPLTGMQMSLAEAHSLEEFADFDSFYAWYKREMVAAAKRCMAACNLLDTSYPVFFPSPFLSAGFAGCVAKGEDAAATGPDYCFSTGNICGMANTVDSLLAIRQLVFEEKRLSLPQLAAVLAANFEGHTEIQAYIQNKCQKFGNDDDLPNFYAKDLTELFCDTVNGTPNLRGAHWQTGLYTVEDHSHMGKKTGALPDGRLAGVSLANAIAPAQGRDTQGPTAVMNSVLSFDHRRAANGLVLDLKFNPSFFERESNQKLLRLMVETYFENGGLEVQFNVVSRETLLAAQREPQKYRNLVVRVSGFSAYFVLLNPVTQNEIIQRTEYHAI